MLTNFCQVPNVIIDEVLRDLNPHAGIILIVIVRKTLGWHKASDAISITQFMKMTNKGKGATLRALKELELAEYDGDRVLHVVKRRGRISVYSLNKNLISKGVPEKIPVSKMEPVSEMEQGGSKSSTSTSTKNGTLQKKSKTLYKKKGVNAKTRHEYISDERNSHTRVMEDLVRELTKEMKSN